MYIYIYVCVLIYSDIFTFIGHSSIINRALVNLKVCLDFVKPNCSVYRHVVEEKKN